MVVKPTKAMYRYQEALEDWTSTSEIEGKLGLVKTGVRNTLMRYLKLGLVERRARGGVFSKNTGWEWRWVR